MRQKYLIAYNILRIYINELLFYNFFMSILINNPAIPGSFITVVTRLPGMNINYIIRHVDFLYVHLPGIHRKYKACQ
jgi:hypothetical protein